LCRRPPLRAPFLEPPPASPARRSARPCLWLPKRGCSQLIRCDSPPADFRCSSTSPPARAFARQLGFRITFRFVRLVAALLPMKIHAGISGILRRRPILFVLPLKTFQAGPRFQQRAIHGEVFVRCPSLLARLCHHPRQKFLGQLGLQPPIAVLGAHRRLPHRTIHIYPHEPSA